MSVTKQPEAIARVTTGTLLYVYWLVVSSLNQRIFRSSSPTDSCLIFQIFPFLFLSFYPRRTSLQLVVNKVYSPSTLSSVDYKFFPVCHQNENDNNNVNNNNAAVGESTSQWHQTASAWYGDAFRILSSIPPLPILQDVYCAPMECGSIASNANTNNNPIVFDDSAWIMEWEMAIARDYAYHAQLDDLPVECRLQDEYVFVYLLSYCVHSFTLF